MPGLAASPKNWFLTKQHLALLLLPLISSSSPANLFLFQAYFPLSYEWDKMYLNAWTKAEAKAGLCTFSRPRNWFGTKHLLWPRAGLARFYGYSGCATPDRELDFYSGCVTANRELARFYGTLRCLRCWTMQHPLNPVSFTKCFNAFLWRLFLWAMF